MGQMDGFAASSLISRQAAKYMEPHFGRTFDKQIERVGWMRPIPVINTKF